MGISTDLATDLNRIRELTEKDKEQLRKLIIDFFAAAYAGYRQNRVFNRAVEDAVLTRGGAEESVVLFRNRKYPAGTAAFMNTVYGHGAELDDGNKKAAGHAGVHIIPAVFALADRLESTQDEVLTALATGYEAFIRLSSAAQPGMVKRGFHSTGMAGALACAAACSRLYHADARETEDAIALATTLAGGLLSYGDSRPAIKPLNPGRAAENGVFAAALAHGGVRGPEEALEGQNGWFHAVTDEIHPEMLRGSDHLLLHDCYFKQYPSCRHTHCGIDAAAALHDRVAPAEIKAIRVYLYPNAIRLAGIRIPKDQDETKFSIPYTLACALERGSYGIEDMDPPRLTEEILRLIDCIEMIPDESMEDRTKGIRGTRIEIRKTDGTVLSETVLTPKGDPENPLTREDILRKLRVCAGTQADDETLELLIRAIDNIGGSEAFRNPMGLVGTGPER